MNKKADERVLSIYLFIIYTIVAVGIVGGVLLFYGPLDVRSLEAGVLTDKVIDCLVEQGELKEFDVEGCGFDFKDNTGIYEGKEQYYIRAELYDFDSCARSNGVLECSDKLKENIELGRKDYFEYCELKGDKLPKCNLKEVYILEGGAKRLLRVYGVVGKVKDV